MKQFNTLFTFKLLFLSILEIHNTLLSQCYEPPDVLRSNHFIEDLVKIAMIPLENAENMTSELIRQL